jgi:hypothetical protein
MQDHATTYRVCWTLTLILFVTAAAAAALYGVPRSLNEIGDAVSGFSGVMAFIWLVGGLFVQQRELASTRSTMEAQAEYQRRQDCFAGAQMYIAGLENTGASFRAVFLVANSSVLKLDRELAIGLQSFWILGKRVEQLESANAESARRDLKPYVGPLNQEIRRFHQGYCALSEFLAKAPDGAIVRSALIENSIYADVDREIVRLSTKIGLVGDIYQIDRP